LISASAILARRARPLRRVEDVEDCCSDGESAQESPLIAVPARIAARTSAAPVGVPPVGDGGRSPIAPGIASPPRPAEASSVSSLPQLWLGRLPVLLLLPSLPMALTL
jgi:hypothetical protein